MISCGERAARTGDSLFLPNVFLGRVVHRDRDVARVETERENADGQDVDFEKAECSERV